VRDTVRLDVYEARTINKRLAHAGADQQAGVFFDAHPDENACEIEVKYEDGTSRIFTFHRGYPTDFGDADYMAWMKDVDESIRYDESPEP
jgi:hypothetical protein